MTNSYLLTGASGFLGKSLANAFSAQGRLYTLGRSAQNTIVCDLASNVPQLENKYDIVVHNAGKAHIVPKTEKEKQDFYDVNYQGTLNLLKGIEAINHLPKAFIFISTVAVYGREIGDLLSEDTPLNAQDPYGKSKIMAEEAILKWGKEKGVIIGILRLPLVAGTHPPGNLQKMIHAQKAGYYFQIGKGSAKRSVVSAKDVANIIPKVAEVGGIYNLTDGQHPTFKELGQVFAEKLEVKHPHVMPPILGKLLATAGDLGGAVLRKNLPFNSRQLSKMTSSLTFSDKKAVESLGWRPEPVLSYFKHLSKTDLIHD